MGSSWYSYFYIDWIPYLSITDNNRFQLSTEIDFSTLIMDTLCTFSHRAIFPYTLSGKGTRYFFRIRSEGKDYFSSWYRTGSFINNSVTSVDNIDNSPVNFTLSQNYPNPFNPTTTLQYGLPEQSDVTVIIYNVVGRKIKEFQLSNQKAGWHEIVWDGTNNQQQKVSTGIYIYQMHAGDFIQTKKMVFMK